jgi:TonB-linked SusC/RagA family outer membrane protein
MENLWKFFRDFMRKKIKVLRIMKLTFILLIVGVLQLSANVYSQNGRMNVQVSEMELYDILWELQQNTDVVFVYRTSDLEGYEKVSLDKEDATLTEILDEVLANTDLEYKFDEDVVVISKRRVEISASEEVEEQQQKSNYKVSGKVTDEKGEPLPGVTVKLEGTYIGTATNIDGMFQFTSTTKSGTVIVSFVGKKTQKLTFVAGTPLIVKLQEDHSNLDEVTVVAYGESKKREMVGSVTTIKSDEIKNVPAPTVSSLLQGRVAGMDVTNVSGAPGGGGVQVTIRGYNSLNTEVGRNFSNPLWVVDGVPMQSFTSPVTGTNALADLNPETIESIQVLKDASSTSLYGARAANGVILVTTKKGRKDQKGQFSVNISQTYSVLPEYPTVYGGKGERAYRLQAFRNHRKAYYDSNLGQWVYPESAEEAYNQGWRAHYDNYWKYGGAWDSDNGDALQDSLNTFYNNSSDFFKHFYQKGKITNANIQTYGGSERTAYSIGIGYYDEEGIAVNTGFSRANLMGNFSAKPVDGVNVIFNNSLSYTDRNKGVTNSQLASGVGVDLVAGNPYALSTLLPSTSDVLDNALAQIKKVKEKNVSYRVRSTFGVDVDLLDGLKFSNKTSVDFSQNNRNYFAPSSLDNQGRTVSTGEVARNLMLLNESLLTYKYSLNETHNFDAMFGVSYQKDEHNYNGGTAKGGPSDAIHYVGDRGWPVFIDHGNWVEGMKNYKSDFVEKKLMSAFGRINYNYSQKYLFTATVRRDGSSVFGEDVRWATFPSVGLGWNFSEEDFMDGFEWLDHAKLRASYGVSGNTFDNAYLSYGILNGYYPYNGRPTVRPEYDGGSYNPNLTWEETKQLDIGIDLNLFNYRLQVTADFYDRLTDQMLYKIQVPGNYSAYSSEWRNAAAISNQGLELELKYDVFRKEDAFWRVSFNIAKNWNKFKRSYNGKDLLDTDPEKLRYYVLGREVNAIYGYIFEGYYQNTDEVPTYYDGNGELRPVHPNYGPDYHYAPGNSKFRDVNEDGVVNYKDQVYLGSSLPKMYGGLINEAKWKNFDLNMLISYSIGRDMVNAIGTSSLSTNLPLSPIFKNLDNTTFWEKPGDETDYPMIAAERYNNDWSPVQDRFVETVNYVKLKSLTLGYTLPKNLFKKMSLRFFFSGENLLTLTNYSGIDPETVDMTSGIDDGRNYPLARKLTLGLTLKL